MPCGSMEDVATCAEEVEKTERAETEEEGAADADDDAGAVTGRVLRVPMLMVRRAK